MTDENGWTKTYQELDEGHNALSIIFYQVGKLQTLVAEDPLDEAPDRLEAIHGAARLLQAYISGLKARRG